MTKTESIHLAERLIADYEGRIAELRRDIAGMKRARDQTSIVVAS